MRISNFKIFSIFTVLSLVGVFFFFKLSVKLNPSSSLPSITVSYNWSNASPYSLERSITSKLEASFSTLKGVKAIKSKSSKGNGYILLEFDTYKDLDIARFEVAMLIRQVYKKLPEQSSYPTININRPNDEEDSAFLSYSIKANTSALSIKEQVTSSIEPIIGAIKDVDHTEVSGANAKEYVITTDNLLLKTLKISKNDIAQALQKAFAKEGLGSFIRNERFLTFSIVPHSQLLDKNIPIKKIQNRIIYLRDIATIMKQEQEAQSFFRINGDNAVTLHIFPRKRANVISLADEIENILRIESENLPKGYTITKTYDSTEYLKQELAKIYKRSFYTVGILLLFILCIYGSLKYLLIAVISLGANICIAFLFYFLFQIEIQLYSLAGITISLGLIIDNSIVMIDHIKHQHNKSVFISILAATLTTIGALSVIYFLDDQHKMNLIDFALVIMINLSISLGVAFYLIPALMEKIQIPFKAEKNWSSALKKRFYNIYRHIISFQLRFKKLAILIIILIFGIPFFMLPDKLEKNETWYEKTYNNTLGSDWYVENVKPHIDTYLGGTFRLFNVYVFENVYYSRNAENKLYVIATLEKGATVHQVNEVFLTIENYLKQYEAIKKFTTIVYNDYGRIEITFKNQYSNSVFPDELKSRIIEKVINFGGMDWSVYGVGRGFNNQSGSNEYTNFSVTAKGYNYDELNSWADSLKVSLKEHPRIQKIYVRENSPFMKKPTYEYRFLLDREKLALANITTMEIIEELQYNTLSKNQDFSLNVQGENIPIRLESKQSKEFDIWHIKNIPLDSLKVPILLKNIAEVSKERQDESIYRENQEYIRLVQFEYTGTEKYGSDVLDAKLEKLKEKLPIGYTFEKSKRSNLFTIDENNYTALLILVLGIIYLICAILFESLKQPFIILSLVPITFIGVFLTFYVFNFSFDQGGLACFILLSGITVNSSIFIINGFNNLKKEFPNTDKLQLYIEAFKQKIVPILLTILSTILGFIPFVIEGQNEVFWFALGAGTIGGLLFSLIAIFFYLPIFTLKKIV
ncbi:Swarming motility protein SwrC [Kordia antarctica]|uniref:Swarming motility protein SwrC n=1 Tax=Kordia antarctica TaxID=1218801 RepID=A0A7L4ZQH3_9FLAO|nr:efflux RND transporter permease subunit [Kordia antarctica]QHI38416.1 Swarming motility protein SwrC [Kordia antarctica]